MKHLLPLLLLAPVATLAQAPVITTIIPMANARAAARTSPVTVNFNQPLTAASAGALKVFSSQRGGFRSRGTTPATVNGNTLSFAPTAYPFMPGETVQYTVTTAATGSGGALAQARVGQFTAAVGGTGNGQFLAGSTVSVGQTPWSVAVGDLDGDGDLDLLSASNRTTGLTGSISIRLNNGRGIFTGTQEVNVNMNPQGVVLGDFDGDGDLDFVAINHISSSLSVRYNTGNGTFSLGQELLLPIMPSMVKVGDLDGDGDLDLAIASLNGTNVAIVLNSGNSFQVGSTLGVANHPMSLTMGDLDGDGDLDLLVAHAASYMNASQVLVCLNNGNGTFSTGQSLAISTDPWDITAGDIDGDGDMDLLLANFTSSSTVSVRRNNGAGFFGGSQEVAVGTSPFRVLVADVDGDSDLDLLAVSYSSNTLSLQLNNGQGNFTNSQPNIYLASAQNLNVAVGATFGDVDGDGDLDLLASATDNTVRVLLNNGTTLSGAVRQPDAAGLAVYPNPAHGSATLTGTSPYAPITILDALGRVLLTATADATGTVHLVLPESVPAGVYLVRSGQQVRRLVVE